MLTGKRKNINVHCNQAELSHVSVNDSAQGEYRNLEVHGMYILTGKFADTYRSEKFCKLKRSSTKP